MNFKAFSELEVFKLRSLVMSLDKAADEILSKNTKINYSEFLVMIVVDSFPGFTQRQVSEILNQTQSNLSRKIDILFKKGFLLRLENENNRREHILRLTHEGKKIVTKAYSLLNKSSEEVLGGLTDEERKILGLSLDKLLSYFGPPLTQ